MLNIAVEMVSAIRLVFLEVLSPYLIYCTCIYTLFEL